IQVSCVCEADVAAARSPSAVLNATIDPTTSATARQPTTSVRTGGRPPACGDDAGGGLDGMSTLVVCGRRNPSCYRFRPFWEPGALEALPASARCFRPAFLWLVDPAVALGASTVAWVAAAELFL